MGTMGMTRGLTPNRWRIFMTLCLYCIRNGAVLGVVIGALLGLPLALIGVLPGALIGGIAGLSTGLFVGLIVGMVTLGVFYPLRNRPAYQLFVTLTCIGGAWLCVTLDSFWFFKFDTLPAQQSVMLYCYYLPIILAVAISGWVSLRLTERYAAVQDQDPYASKKDGFFRPVLGISVGVIVCLVAAAISAGLLWRAAHPLMQVTYRWLLPQGDGGRVAVTFDAMGASPLPLQFGSLIPTDYDYDAANGTQQALKHTGKTYPDARLGGIIWLEGITGRTMPCTIGTTYELFVGT